MKKLFPYTKPNSLSLSLVTSPSLSYLPFHFEIRNFFSYLFKYPFSEFFNDLSSFNHGYPKYSLSLIMQAARPTLLYVPLHTRGCTPPLHACDCTPPLCCQPLTSTVNLRWIRMVMWISFFLVMLYKLGILLLKFLKMGLRYEDEDILAAMVVGL